MGGGDSDDVDFGLGDWGDPQGVVDPHLPLWAPKPPKKHLSDDSGGGGSVESGSVEGGSVEGGGGEIEEDEEDLDAALDGFNVAARERTGPGHISKAAVNRALPATLRHRFSTNRLPNPDLPMRQALAKHCADLLERHRAFYWGLLIASTPRPGNNGGGGSGAGSSAGSSAGPSAGKPGVSRLHCAPPPGGFEVARKRAQSVVLSKAFGVKPLRMSFRNPARTPGERAAGPPLEAAPPAAAASPPTSGSGGQQGGDGLFAALAAGAEPEQPHMTKAAKKRAEAAAKAAADAEAETRRALQRKETQKLIGLVADFAGVVRGRALRNAREALLVLEGPDHEDD